MNFSERILSFWEWFLPRADTRGALAFLFGLSFLDSCLIVLPPELPLALMTLARPARWWVFGLIAGIGAAAGAAAGYAIGALAFKTVGLPILHVLGFSEHLARLATLFGENGFWTVLLVGLTPIPFIPIVYAAGFFHVPPFLFVAAAFLSRTCRYLIAALAFRLIGPPLLPVLRRLLDSGRSLALSIIGILLAVLFLFLLLRH